MKATLRKIGNSQGVIIPKALIEALSLEGGVTVEIECGALVLRPIEPKQDDALTVKANRWDALNEALGQANEGPRLAIYDERVWIQVQSAFPKKGVRHVHATLTWNQSAEHAPSLDFAGLGAIKATRPLGE